VGGHWAAIGGKGKEPGRPPQPWIRATYTRTAGIRHLFAACELGEDRLYGHIKRKTRSRFMEFCRPVHHLAQQPRLRRTTPPHSRPGKRSLMRN
jgi:hypothetical protein